MLVLHDHVNSLWDRMEVVVGTMTIGFSVFGYLHLLVLLSLYFGWKGTPMTLTVCFAAGFLYVSGVYGSRMQAAERCGAFVFTTLMICVVMFVLQQLILRRLTELAETA